MPKYYLNLTPQSTGEHEVHAEGCKWLKLVSRPEYLGFFSNCHEAVENAKFKHASYIIDGCKHCCPGCHTR
jgi:hypothetical protein